MVRNRERERNRIELVDEAVTESAAPLHGKFRKRDGPNDEKKRVREMKKEEFKLQKRPERKLFWCIKARHVRELHGSRIYTSPDFVYHSSTENNKLQVIYKTKHVLKFILMLIYL